MQWLKPENILHGGRKQTLIDSQSRTVATVVQLPGTLTRGYIYSPPSSTVDEPTWELCKARVSDLVGLTTGAYRSQRESDATPTVIETPSNHPDWI
jgi:hypothetical protein